MLIEALVFISSIASPHDASFFERCAISAISILSPSLRFSMRASLVVDFRALFALMRAGALHHEMMKR